MSEFGTIVVGAATTLACAAHVTAKGWTIGVFERRPASREAVQTLEATTSRLPS